MTTQDKMLGTLTPFTTLDTVEQELVLGTWAAAERAYIPRSNFPVGSVILAQNEQGETAIFSGCNVENRFHNPTICAERNAATSAVAAGYRKFLKIALVCKNYQGPGANSCGLCRQVMTEFGCDAVVLGLADKQNNVYKFTVGELLPAATGEAVHFAHLAAGEKRLVKRLEALLLKSYVPYSKAPRAAVFTASNADGATRHFVGISDDNASYGGAALAECVAMRTARTAGYFRNVSLAVTVGQQWIHNPIEGECLQVLREFGRQAPVLLIGKDRSVLHTSLIELLPDSFGPESLV